ncbi:MAG TPA: cupin domain-containing protein [Candidatus Angelobacter sp.]|nr:cupin domain-containing protein [Candidatus Angelobacter sp.]
MLKVHEAESAYRFGDHGPKYLSKGPNIDIGVVQLKPGQDFQNHYHTTVEETFYILEGAIDFYINNEKVKAEKGNLIKVSPTETHYLINNSDQNFRALFIKSPHLEEKDSVNVDNPILEEDLSE